MNSHPGNVITIALAGDSQQLEPDSHAISICDDRGICIKRPYGTSTVFHLERGLGAIYLRPLPAERLELVIWGHDSQGLDQATRLAPMLAGVGQPDFIVVSERCACYGAQGVLAMGFFDSLWNVSESSFIT